MSTIKVTNLQNASAASPAIVLDANSRATLNGLSYPTEGSLSGRSRIINGSMMIDQRNAGAAVTTSGAYVVDRFCQTQSGGGVISWARSTVAPAGFTNSLSGTVSTADTSIAAGDIYRVYQIIEGFNSADLSFGSASAKTVTLSFWVRSSITGTYCVGLQNGSFNRSYATNYTISAANTWEYKTITIAGDTSGTWATDNSWGIAVFWDLGTGSSYNQSADTWSATNTWKTSSQTSWIATNGATFYITGVQLEAGSVATPFERRSYGQELALCERYYQVYGNVFGIVFHNYSSAQAFGGIPLRTAMRHNPTADYIIPYNNAAVSYYSNGGAGKTLTALSLNAASPNYIQLTVTGTLGTGGDAGHLDANSANALKFTAEL